jgi:hypothetical protein
LKEKYGAALAQIGMLYDGKLCGRCLAVAYGIARAPPSIRFAQASAMMGLIFVSPFLFYLSEQTGAEFVSSTERPAAMFR